MSHLEVRQGSGTQIKKEIYNRSMWLYVCFVIMALGFVARVLQLQYSEEGTALRNESKNIKNVEHRMLKARRGDILTYDNKVLASTIPLYHVYMDFRSNGLDSAKFNANVKPLANELAGFYKDKPASVYLDSLKRWYSKGYRYKKISPRRINYIELRTLLTFPLFKEGRYKGGWALDTLENRVFPYGELASRTIGSINEAGRKIGIEGSQDSILSGQNGVGLYQKVSGTFWVPIEDTTNSDPIDGLNVVSTIDIEVQDVAEKILRKQLVDNEASWGTAILMDVKSGEIRALANLGRKKDGSYADIYNYAIGQNMEPGSTFKIVSLLALLEDSKMSINQMVDCGRGSAMVGSAKVNDSHRAGYGVISVGRMFEVSSNIGFARSIYGNYHDNPQKFLNFIKSRNFDKSFDFAIKGEAKPMFHEPGDKSWSKSTLPMMAYGYELLYTPIHTLAIYNAVANSGIYIKPKIIKHYTKGNRIVKEVPTDTLCSAICSDKNLRDIKFTMEQVVNDGTAKVLLNPNYKVAGKTGTAQVSKGRLGYHYDGGRNYLATVVGYFPADNPKYSCIVAIETFHRDGSSQLYYGGSLSGPVFRSIADKVYSQAVEWGHNLEKPTKFPPVRGVDSVKRAASLVSSKRILVKGGDGKKIDNVARLFKLPVNSSGGDIVAIDSSLAVSNVDINVAQVPNVKGMGLRDAIYTLNSMGFTISTVGVGTVSAQIPSAGAAYVKGDSIKLILK